MTKPKEVTLKEFYDPRSPNRPKGGYGATPKRNRICAECGGELKWAQDARRGNQANKNDQAYFCCPACRIKYNNRLKTRGAAVLPYLMEWRKGPRSAEALAMACQIIGRYLDEDKQAGRDSFLPNYHYRQRRF